MWVSGLRSNKPLSTRRHSEEAHAFATRRPANEGSLHFASPENPSICHPEQSEGSAVLSIRNPGCPTSRDFSRCGCPQVSKTLGITRISQPVVILRKRRPSQREGLPTKDLCTPTPQTKSNSWHPEQSEGSAVLTIRNPGCPTSRVFEMWRSGSEKTPGINHVTHGREP